MNDDAEEELLTFAEETDPTEEEIASGNSGKWRVLIVDDEEGVFQITKVTLDDVSVDGKGLELLGPAKGILGGTGEARISFQAKDLGGNSDRVCNAVFRLKKGTGGD